LSYKVNQAPPILQALYKYFNNFFSLHTFRLVIRLNNFPKFSLTLGGMKALDEYYEKQPEPHQSCLLTLREIILGYNPQIRETWKYQTPFFLFDGKMLCYLSVDRRIRLPYVGMVEGRYLDHPALESGGRKRIKVLSVNPTEDLPIDTLEEVLEQAIALYRS